MLLEASVRRPGSGHVIVFGNEKGGSGKSTTCMHVAVGLLKAGQRVATIDLDSRQKTFTHYVESRRAWAERSALALEIPTHFHVARGEGARVDDNEAVEFAGFADAIAAVEHSHDFVLIDTPATDSYLMRLAHSMADTLVTPLNDSFDDFCGHRREPLRRDGAPGAAPAPHRRRRGDRLDRGAQPPLDDQLAQQAG